MADTNAIREILDSRAFTRQQSEALDRLLALRPSVFPYSTVPTTWTNQPAAATPLFGAAAGSRAIPIDLSAYSEARITAVVATGGATGATLRLYGATVTPLTSGAYSAIGAVSVALASTGVIDSGWSSIPAASRVATFCDVWGVGGDAAADPALGTILLWLR